MKRIALDLPDVLAAHVADATKLGGFMDEQDYLRSLIRRDLELAVTEPPQQQHARAGAPLVDAADTDAHAKSLGAMTPPQPRLFLFRSWREAVLSALERYCKRHQSREVFRARFLAEELDQMVRETLSRGRTPEMTVSRVLQELRDENLVEFLTPGHYRFHGSK
jgi:hypothetical protein